jgi:hypothetical protein
MTIFPALRFPAAEEDVATERCLGSPRRFRCRRVRVCSGNAVGARRDTGGGVLGGDDMGEDAADEPTDCESAGVSSPSSSGERRDRLLAGSVADGSSDEQEDSSKVRFGE